MSPITLTHARVELALHELRGGGTGRPLLLLHGLGERTSASVPGRVAHWPGPVFGLDFTGHGSSTVPKGGGYTPEILMGDADMAVAELGQCTVVGRGLGAYVALLLAGARTADVRGAVLLDGPGLSGGGVRAPSPRVAHVPDEAATRPPDPWAFVELTADVRPADYATTFARQATMFSELEAPITVAAIGRPSWVEAVLGELGVVTGSVEEALEGYAAL